MDRGTAHRMAGRRPAVTADQYGSWSSNKTASTGSPVAENTVHTSISWPAVTHLPIQRLRGRWGSRAQGSNDACK